MDPARQEPARSVAIPIRFRPAVAAELRALAAVQERSVSSLVKQLVSESLVRHIANPPPKHEAA